MTKTVTLTKVRAKPGKREELIELCKQNMKVDEGEGDLLFVSFHQAINDPDEFWFYELYQNRAAWAAHMTSEWRDMMRHLTSLIEGEDWSSDSGSIRYSTELTLFAAKGIGTP
jgi:quinol monooxygenase YgiN